MKKIIKIIAFAYFLNVCVCGAVLLWIVVANQTTSPSVNWGFYWIAYTAVTPMLIILPILSFKIMYSDK